MRFQQQSRRLHPAGRGVLVATALVLVGATACTTGKADPNGSSHLSIGTTDVATVPTTGQSASSGPSDPATTGTGSGAPTSVPPSSTGVPPSTSSRPVSAPASIVVTYSGWNASSKVAEVDAFAPGVLVADATCTLTMTHAGLTRTASRKATPGPSSTQCGALTVPGSKLVSGDWRAVVRFASSSATGSSDPVTIRVAL